MWCLGTWFSGGLGRDRLVVGLDDLKALFQLKQFYDYSFLLVRVSYPKWDAQRWMLRQGREDGRG